MHKRLALLTPLCLLLYLFSPDVHLGRTTMKTGVCQGRSCLSVRRGRLGTQGWGAPTGAQGRDHPSCQGSVFPLGTSQWPVYCSCGPDGIFGDASPPPPTTPAGFPPQMPNDSCVPIHRHHSAAHPSFPHGLIAALPVFPEFYLAFTVCFYDV